jgi:hypothetical protein
VKEALIRIKDGAVPEVRIRKGRWLAGRWIEPTSEAEWDEARDTVSRWVSLDQHVAYLEWREAEQAAAAERRAAGLPEPEYDEPF